jgi:hypothetical protein
VHETQELRLGFITLHDIGLDPLRHIIADAGGHVQRIGESDEFPTAVSGLDRDIMRDLKIENVLAVLLGQSQR